MLYTWSSRGPAIDGSFGVAICGIVTVRLPVWYSVTDIVVRLAPGGAIAPVTINKNTFVVVISSNVSEIKHFGHATGAAVRAESIASDEWQATLDLNANQSINQSNKQRFVSRWRRVVPKARA